MSGLVFKSQINMQVEPTEDNHVARRTDIKTVFDSEPTAAEKARIPDGQLVYIRRGRQPVEPLHRLPIRRFTNVDEFKLAFPVGQIGDLFGLMIAGGFVIAGWDNVLGEWVFADAIDALNENVWFPSVDDDGLLTWELSASAEPPRAVNIRGPEGLPGRNGGLPIGSIFLSGIWTEDRVEADGEVYHVCNGARLERDEVSDLILPTGGKIAHRPMTSNTAPAPQVASASSIFSASFPEWRAFSGTPGTTTNNDCWASEANAFVNNIGNEWIQIDLGQEINIVRHRMRNRGFHPTVIDQPRDWALLGSNDGTSWNTVDTRTDIPWMNQNWSLFFDERITPASFRYWRINITRIHPGGTGNRFVAIGEIELFTNDFYDIPNIPNAHGFRHYMRIK